VGTEALDDLFLLREADNIGSGGDGRNGGLDEIRGRVAAELAAGLVLDLHGLAIDGDDLMAELGLMQGPRLGRVLDGLLERVIADPTTNQRATLLALARSMVADGSAPGDGL
jgi:hypothetical protein